MGHPTILDPNHRPSTPTSSGEPSSEPSGEPSGEPSKDSSTGHLANDSSFAPSAFKSGGSHRVYVAHHDDRTRREIETILQRLGHQIHLSTGLAVELHARALEQPADLMVVSRVLKDRDGIETLRDIGKISPRPAIVLASSDDVTSVERAMSDHVMAYLVEPVTEVDLMPAIFLAVNRFEYYVALQNELAELQTRLESRKIIERAKGILMSQSDVDENQAHRKLQSLARSQRTKVIEVAKRIVERLSPDVSTNPAPGGSAESDSIR